MKKFYCILCCILMLPMLLVGCGKEAANLNITEDFVAIQNIEYTTMFSSNNYSRTNLQSRFYIDAEINSATEEEYNSATNKLEDYEYKDYISGIPYNDGYSYSSPTFINKDNNNVPDINNEKLNAGTTYFYKLHYYDYDMYIRCKIKSFKIVYVQMKIISDSVIEILNDNEHYIVQTVYYKANFFN